MPVIRGMISASASARSAISTTAPRCWNSSARNELRRRWPRSAPPAPTISCAPRSGRWSSTSIPPTRTSTRRSPACDAALEAYRDDYAAYYERCKHADSPADARPQPGGLPGARRRHDHLRQGQGHGAHRRRVLRQRDQRDARRRRRLHLSAACPSRKPSTSNTGCSKRPSCSACRSRRALAGRVALVTGGAGGIGQATAGGCCRKAPASCWPTSTQTRWTRPRPSFGKRYGARHACAPSLIDVTERGRGRSTRFARRALRIRRPRHPASPTPASPRRRRSRTPRSSCGTRNMDILATGYFLVAAPGLPAVEAQEHRRRDRLHRLQERPGRLARRLGLLHGQGGGNPPGPLPGAGRRAARHPRQRRSTRTRCCAARRIWHGEWREQRAAAYNMIDATSSRSIYRKRSHAEARVYPEDIAEAVYFFASRHVGQVDRQHPQRRRRQRRSAVHPLIDYAGEARP